MKARCSPCYGSGKIMGGGMITQPDCPHCHGTGKFIQTSSIDFVEAKKTKGYLSAKKRLQKRIPGMEEKAIEELLDKELSKEIGNG